MTKNCTHFKPKFDLHTLCRISRPCNRYHTCHICQAWPESCWLHIKRLKDKSKAANIKRLRAILASKMSSTTSDSDGGLSSTPSWSSKSSMPPRKQWLGHRRLASRLTPLSRLQKAVQIHPFQIQALKQTWRGYIRVMAT